MGGEKRLFRLFYQTTSLETFTTLSVDYFMNVFKIKPIRLSLKSALEESKVKHESQACQ